MGEIPLPHNEIDETKRSDIIARLKAARERYNNIFRSILDGGIPGDIGQIREMAEWDPAGFRSKYERSTALANEMQKQISSLGISVSETEKFWDMRERVQAGDEGIDDGDLAFADKYLNNIDLMCQNIMQEGFGDENFTFAEITGRGENAKF